MTFVHDCGQGMRPPRRSDPTIEFHEQDNLALESLGSHFGTSVTDGFGTEPDSTAAGDAATGSLYPPADFIYDNSCYNNMRQVMLFPGALDRYECLRRHAFLSLSFLGFYCRFSCCLLTVCLLYPDTSEWWSAFSAQALACST